MWWSIVQIQTIFKLILTNDFDRIENCLKFSKSVCLNSFNDLDNFFL